MNKIKVGVIGTGYFGAYHTEKYDTIENCQLIGVFDTNEEKADTIAQKYSCQSYHCIEELLQNIDAASICVPTIHHYVYAKACLQKKIHVLIEKPVTSNIEDAQKLIKMAEQQKVKVQIGFLERFNPIYKKIYPYIKQPRFIESIRTSQTTQRTIDVDVLLDLMIHDLDLIIHLTASKIVNIEAIGMSVVSDKVDVANVRIKFANQCIAQITASRYGTKKIRQTRIFQDNLYISLDLDQQQAHLLQRSDDKAIEKKSFSYQKTDLVYDEIKSFLDAIHNDTQPAVSIYDGYKALEICCDIQNKIQNYVETRT